VLARPNGSGKSTITSYLE